MNRETRQQFIVAERAISLVEQRIKVHMDRCGYCESGVNAYELAECAIELGIRDVRKIFSDAQKELKL